MIIHVKDKETGFIETELINEQNKQNEDIVAGVFHDGGTERWKLENNQNCSTLLLSKWLLH